MSYCKISRRRLQSSSSSPRLSSEVSGDVFVRSMSAFAEITSLNSPSSSDTSYEGSPISGESLVLFGISFLAMAHCDVPRLSLLVTYRSEFKVLVAGRLRDFVARLIFAKTSGDTKSCFNSSFDLCRPFTDINFMLKLVSAIRPISLEFR